MHEWHAGVPPASGNVMLAPMCGDTRCSFPCPGAGGRAAAADCFEPPPANSTSPRIEKDCFEHNVFGAECSGCNVTDSCPDWCDELRASGCQAYELICGYVETVEFQGALEDLVTRGPLFCRRMDCEGAAGEEGACWFTVDGHEVCCIGGLPTYVTGSGSVVPGFEGAFEPEAMGPAALAPGEVEVAAAGARGRVGGTLGAALVAAVVAGVMGWLTNV